MVTVPGLPPEREGEPMASIPELRELIARTLAAAQDAAGPDQPLLMAQADAMRAEIARRTGDEPDETET